MRKLATAAAAIAVFNVPAGAQTGADDPSA